MALIHAHVYSEVLGLSTSMYAILPQRLNLSAMEDKAGRHRRLYPVLYLLHGLSDDHTMWLRRTSIERYADSLGLAVVMPEVHRSFYTDIDKHRRYWTYVSEELPAIAAALFPLSVRRDDVFVAGLSMGGYGAFKLGLSLPERFAAAASLSGALDVSKASEFMGEEASAVFGGNPAAGTDNDLFELAERAARADGPRTQLYQCCGTEDFLYDDNRRFLEHARKLRLNIAYEEEPGGHDWEYWDRNVRRVLEWLPIRPDAGEE